MLTKKQLQLLEFIHARTRINGVSPSFDEMKVALDLKSKSGIHRLITALEERGFIRRLPHRARAIAVLQMPEQVQPKSRGFAPRLITGDRPERPRDAMDLDPADARSLPIMGRIAAGVPISAIQDHARDVAVPVDMISNAGQHYALEVKGDSMIVVVIRETSTAQNGDIVVALVEDHEATLKRFRRNGSAIALEAANPAYETRVFRDDQVKIQGRLVGLIRTY